MYEFIRYAAMCWQAWQMAKTKGMAYRAATENGVPQVAVFVALDREAWRVTQFALDSLFEKK